MPKRQDLHAIDLFELKVKMLRNHITERQIAKQLRVTRQAVGNGLTGTRHSILPKIEKVVNKLIRGK